MIAAAFEPRRAAPLPDGFRTRRVADGHFSVALPRAWLALTRIAVAHPGAARTLARADADAAPFVTALAMPESPLKLVAFERLGSDTTLSVLVTEAEGGATFELWSQAMAAQVKRLPSFVGPLRESRVRLPAGDALRLEYRRRTGGRVLATVQYAVVRNGHAYVLVFATPPGRQARHAALFAQAAESLDLD